MRKVALQMGVSVDGYVSGGPNRTLDPGRRGEHPGVVAWKLDRLAEAGVHIMGRVAYEQMAAHWPNSTEAYAAPMNDLPKVVFSRTLTTTDWPTTRIADGDLTDEISRLKEEPGGDIVVHGGALFVQALSQRGLIDEYRLVTYPAALGSGQPMFKDLDTVVDLELVEVNPFDDGTIITVYRTRQ